jgi:hypothetical protein
MALTLENLQEMSQQQLDDLYRRSEAGEIPVGDTQGTAIVLPGTKWEKPLAAIAHHWFWQGKVFDKEKGELINKITPFHIREIKAKVYKAPSWVDDRETIVIDYSHTSFLAHEIRDEIREVAPGLYLGVVYWGKKKTIDFALQCPATSATASA